MRSAVPALLLLLLSCAASPSFAEDWAQWRGPHRDGISREKGLIHTWPETGPRVLWRKAVTGGYSGFAVAAGRVYTQTYGDKKEKVLCFEAQSGKPVWEYAYDCDYEQYPELSKFRAAGGGDLKSGPRASPTVDGDRVYTLGTTGVLLCLDAKSGKLNWRVDLLKLADRTCPEVGYGSTPVIEGDLLFIHPGGPKGKSLAALGKLTGGVKWTSEDDPVSLSTPIPAELNGKKQVIYFTARGVVSVAPATGKVFWRYDWKTQLDFNITTPIVADGKVFISSNMGHGCALLKPGDGPAPEELYKGLTMQNYFATSILLGKEIYGFSNDRLRCVDFATGKMLWDERGFGLASLLIADGQLIVLSDRGELVLADSTPTGFTARAKWKALTGICCTAPVLANGVLYLRNGKEIVAVAMTA